MDYNYERAFEELIKRLEVEFKNQDKSDVYGESQRLFALILIELRVVP